MGAGQSERGWMGCNLWQKLGVMQHAIWECQMQGDSYVVVQANYTGLGQQA